MTRPADPFADVFEDEYDDGPTGTASGGSLRASVGGRPMQPVVPAGQVVYVPAPPNPWKGAALLLLGTTLGLVTASVVWGIVFAVAWGANAVEEAAGAFGDLDAIASELDTDRVQAALAAEPAATEALGPITSVRVNDDRTYASDTPWDVYYYDAVGEKAAGLVRVRYADDGGFLDADLTLTPETPAGEVVEGEPAEGESAEGDAVAEPRTIPLTLSDPGSAVEPPPAVEPEAAVEGE
ncbi:hypothetical protein [Alienimonas californiensis]|uniref:Uncharacterized protein n=1 Tax=Alienimonas californiensis TaxID=2527989 RepID=A0A517P8L1_9PLAN|nr:hypothetical protein [Alienimonas californiensis]QDT15713.1 hypothetical protein CA12_18030 [Alienimonas californiensis]